MKRIAYYIWEGPVVYASVWRTSNVAAHVARYLDRLTYYSSNYGGVTNVLEDCNGKNDKKICQ